MKLTSSNFYSLAILERKYFQSCENDLRVTRIELSEMRGATSAQTAEYSRRLYKEEILTWRV